MKINMKNIHYILSVLLLTALTSCNDWLDVTPRSQIKGEVLYESEDGYKQALNGVYIKMGAKALYGRNASMNIPEFLAHNWTIPFQTDQNMNVYYHIANFNFKESNSESALENLYSAYYSAIAQINDLLSNLRRNTSVQFNNHNDKLIEGEALGLRAFLHLDLLRLWGPVPDKATDGSEAIPYVTDITNDPSKLLSKTYAEVIKGIETDLNNAENILKEYDPMAYADLDSLNSPNSYYYVGKGTMPKEEWQTKRTSRFNYYATLATKARLYHWIGKKTLAVQYAQAVVDTEKIPLCTESDAQKSLTLYPEHLFGIENIDLMSIIERDYLSEDALFTQTEKNIQTAYESSLNTNDIRYTNGRYWGTETYFNGSTKIFTFYKYVGNDNTDPDKRIPLIRMAELYLILSEDLPAEQAKPYFQTYRIARGMNETLDESTFASESALKERLEKEYRKEFFGEGQMFYFYKKHNYSAYTWPTKFTLSSDKYVLPKPKGQINFETNK